MTITEAEKRCKELNEQIRAIRAESYFGGWAKYCGRIKIKPLSEKLDNLTLAIIKAKETTIIDQALKEIEYGTRKMV